MATVIRVLLALLRGILVLLLVAMPALMLPDPAAEAKALTMLLALSAAVFTFVDYAAPSPVLCSMCTAPPINRLRFCALAVILALLSVLLTGAEAPGILTQLSQVLARWLDVPFSPIRAIEVLFVPSPVGISMLIEGAGLADKVQGAGDFAKIGGEFNSPAGLAPENTPPSPLLRQAAALSYAAAMASILVFAVLLHLLRWPGPKVASKLYGVLGAAVPLRSQKDAAYLRARARLNIVLGLLLSVLLPSLLSALGVTLGASPLLLVWTLSLWSFLPASIVMRGLALNRLARLNPPRAEAAPDLGSIAVPPSPSLTQVAKPQLAKAA